MNNGKRPPRTPSNEGKVVSIVGEIERRRVQRERDKAAATHRRQLESSAEIAAYEAEIEELDFDAGIAELEGDPSPEGRSNLAMLRALRAFRTCKRGDLEGGLAEWEGIMAEYPDVASPYVVRASFWGRTDPARALADYDRAVALEPRDANVYARRGDCYRALGDEERALANYRRAVALDPKLFDAHFGMATALVAQGDLESALASYDRAIRHAPPYVEFYLGRAAVLEKLGKLDRALADYQRIIELDPSREEVRAHRLQLLCRAGQVERAVTETAQRVDRELGDDADALAVVGEMQLALGQRELAIETLTRALAVAPNHAHALAKRGLGYFALGDAERAIADLDRAVELAPSNAKAHETRANALAKLGRMQESVDALTRAIELDPESSGAYALRGIYRSHVEEDDDEGIARVKGDLYRAIELVPTEMVYIKKLGDYLCERWELEEAHDLYDRALAASPDNAELYYQRAYCKSQMIQGRWERDLDDDESDEQRRARCTAALADLEKAIELGKADEDVYFELVRVQEQLGGEDEKLAMLDRALAALPDFVLLRALRYDWRRHRGDAEGAAADRERLVALGFKFPADWA